MINNALLFMCLMGTLSYMFYLLCCLLFREKFSPSQKMVALTITLLFYLVPFPQIMPQIVLKLEQSMPSSSLLTELYNKSTVPVSKLLTITPDGSKYMPVFSKTFWVIGTFWLIVLTFSVIWQMKKYRYIKKTWIAESTNASAEITEYVNTLHKKPHNKKRIRVRISSLNFSPFVIGFFQPIIFLPQSFNYKENDIILKHELYHVAHLHNIIKFISLITVTVHWYCPIVYCFFISFGNALELTCDKKVLKGTTSQQKERYVHYLTDAPAQQKTDFVYVFPISSFKSPQFHTVKERILMIKNINKKPSLLAALLIVLSIPVSALPVFAYQPMVEYHTVSEDRTNVSSDTESFFVPKDEELTHEFDEPMEITYFNSSDSYFETENGEIYHYFNDSIPYVNCKHEFINGYFYTHTPHSDGSCDYYKYSAKRCRFCGTIIENDLISKTFYKICPH